MRIFCNLSPFLRVYGVEGIRVNATSLKSKLNRRALSAWQSVRDIMKTIAGLPLVLILAVGVLLPASAQVTLTRVLEGDIAKDTGYFWGCAWADYDNDGDLDLFVANGGYTSLPGEPNFLYRNDGGPNNWLLVRLVGIVSNRSAIGAKVRVKATIKGNTFWQLREISGGSPVVVGPVVMLAAVGRWRSSWGSTGKPASPPGVCSCG